MIDTTNLSVPATHGKVRAKRLSLRSKQRDAATRKALAESKNLAGGERHYGKPVEPMNHNEEIARHLASEILLAMNGVDVSPTAKRGVYPESQDLQNELSVKPKPQPKAKTRIFKEKPTERKAPKLAEHPKAAAAKGARPRQGGKCDPLEAFIPKAYTEPKKLPLTKKAKEDAAKFERQMEEHLIRTGRFVLI